MNGEICAVMRYVVALILAAALSGCAAFAPKLETDGEPAAGLTTERHIRLGDWTRSYLLHVPSRLPRNRLLRPEPFPLVIMLHGSGANGESIRRQTGMDSLAEAERFLVAYPDGSSELFGLNADWNAGECCGGAQVEHVDDIGFLRAIIADISARLPVDRRRIYIAGFSDGARMTYRAGCEMANELAAIAAVAGSLVDAHCNPARPLPLIAFHGTADDEVPFNESAYTKPFRAVSSRVSSLPSSIKFWMAADGCRDASDVQAGPQVIEHTGVGCAADVVFYVIEGAGHKWPTLHLNGTSTVLSASQIIARFFLRHER